MKKLISRNFCDEMVAVKFRNFHTVPLLLQKFCQINSRVLWFDLTKKNWQWISLLWITLFKQKFRLINGFTHVLSNICNFTVNWLHEIFFQLFVSACLRYSTFFSWNTIKCQKVDTFLSREPIYEIFHVCTFVVVAVAVVECRDVSNLTK